MQFELLNKVDIRPNVTLCRVLFKLTWCHLMFPIISKLKLKMTASGKNLSCNFFLYKMEHFFLNVLRSMLRIWKKPQIRCKCRNICCNPWKCSEYPFLLTSTKIKEADLHVIIRIRCDANWSFMSRNPYHMRQFSKNQWQLHSSIE